MGAIGGDSGGSAIISGGWYPPPAPPWGCHCQMLHFNVTFTYILPMSCSLHYDMASLNDHIWYNWDMSHCVAAHFFVFISQFPFPFQNATVGSKIWLFSLQWGSCICYFYTWKVLKKTAVAARRVRVEFTIETTLDRQRDGLWRENRVTKVQPRASTVA